MNITGLGNGQPASGPAREPAAKLAEAEAWRQAMLNQILTKVRQHEPEIHQAAGRAKAGRTEPEAAPPRKGSLINRYV